MSNLDSLYIGLSGLRVAKQQLSVAALNIANADNENYSRREAILSSSSTNLGGNGVVLQAIERATDPFLVESIRDRASVASYYDKMSEFLENIQIDYGSDPEVNSLNNYMSNFLTYLSELTTKPDAPSIIEETVFTANLLCQKISSLSNALQQRRLEAEQQLCISIESLNENLSIIGQLNELISNYPRPDETLAQYKEEREILLNKVSEEIDIGVELRPDESVLVFAGGNKNLINRSVCTIGYNPLNYVEQFVENQYIQPISLISTDGRGVEHTVDYLATGSGGDDTVKTFFKYGKMKALIELRDTVIPDFIDQLDLFANIFTTNFNDLHNQGTGFPGIQTVTSARQTSLGELRKYQGNFRITIVDENGRPAYYPIDKNGYSRPCYPLNLDLSSLDEGYGPGTISTGTIIKEINQSFYQEALSSRVSLGDIESIKLAATSNLNVVPNGIFNFNFELSNKANNDCLFTVNNITVYDNLGNIVTGALTSVLPPTMDLIAGQTIRTSQPITVNFATGAGGPYRIIASLNVVNNDGTSYNSDVTYQVNDNDPALGTQVINNRYYPVAANNQGIYHDPVTDQAFASAQLIDSNENLITDQFTSGSIVISTENSKYFLSLDDDTSTELGMNDILTPYFVKGQPPSNKGFGHFFGLNNFFIEQTAIPASAMNMKVRQDIIDDSRLITRGQAEQSPSIRQSINVGIAQATGSLKFQANPAVNDVLNINGANFTFVTLATTPAQITIGPTLNATLNNLTSTLNSNDNYNNFGVNVATYSNNGVDTMNIVFDNKGIIGNQFSITGSLANGAAINYGEVATNISGNLYGGETVQEPQMVKVWTYEIGEGSDKIIYELANMNKNTYQFPEYNNMIPTECSFAVYINEIISEASSKTNESNILRDQENVFLNDLTERLRYYAGVDRDFETQNLLIIQKYYVSCTKIIKFWDEMTDALLAIF